MVHRLTKNKTWISAHIFYAEPLDNLILKCLLPLVSQIRNEEGFYGYFFIRYWERGPHIRLRVNVEKEKTKVFKDWIESFVYAFMTAYPSAGFSSLPLDAFPPNSIQWIPYVPEIQRYGGVQGLKVSETHFEHSSDMVLSVLQQHEEELSKGALIGPALEIHFCALQAFKLTIDQMIELNHLFKQQWVYSLVSYNAQSDLEVLKSELAKIFKSFDVKLDLYKDDIVKVLRCIAAEDIANAPFDPWLRNWIDNCSSIKCQLDQINLNPNQWGNESSMNTVKQLLTSYLHMTNNRLGIKNIDEAYMGYLLAQGVKLALKDQLT